MITFTIDELTPCLKDSESGALVQTEVIELKRKSFLSKFNSRNGWYINWGKFAGNTRIFALVIEGTMDIQGMVAVSPNNEAKALHIDWACTAPQNNKWQYGVQKYAGVGGHLIAIASELSVMYGYDGYVYGEAMDETILKHYMVKYGAERLPAVLHPYALVIRGEQTAKIREVYDYVWTGETI